mgnify:CR=1 FL=1
MTAAGPHGREQVSRIAEFSTPGGARHERLPNVPTRLERPAQEAVEASKKQKRLLSLSPQLVV